MDHIPARFLKDSANAIGEVITHIINLSIQLGKVPIEMKRARVLPLFKKNSRTDMKNYRPVSILPSVSKILERVVFDQE